MGGTARLFLLDLGLGAQVFLELGQALLLQLLGDLRLHFFQLGQLGLAHVVQTDHVPAELALHRRVGGLALVELDQGFGEFLHVAAGVGPIQIATLGARTRILGLLLGDVFELRTLLQAGDDVLGFAFLLDQDMAGLVLLATVGGGELVVLSLDFLVGDGVLLLK